MPHSSGGGSSHGGSHHSSHSYGGSSSSSNSSHISSSYFPGSRVFVRYVNRRPTYVYSNSGSLCGGVGSIIFCLLMYSLFVVPALITLIGSVVTPEKLSHSDVSREQIEIVDNISILGDTTELANVLEEFEEVTGVIPVVVTINNSDWESDYNDLEQYAYNWYVYNYSDEKHWVIMYSEDSSDTSMFGDWYWEGMQGDDTDEIITDGIANKFTDRLHDNFIASGSMTRSEAISDAFNCIMPGIMNVHINFEQVLPAVGILLFISFHAFFMLGGILKNRHKYKDYHEVKDVVMQPNNIPLEDTCKYCDGVYVVGSVYNCPHCGAAIPAHNPVNTESDW